jgi:ABC-2 type transport system ATP-binding protein
MCDTVGIIEQGRLLAVGTVQEMRKRMQPHATVRLTVLGGAAAVSEWLQKRPDVEEVRVEGEIAVVAHQGDREAEAGLLRDLIQAGFPIAEFHAETKSLEDVFMHLTDGRVQ